MLNKLDPIRPRPFDQKSGANGASKKSLLYLVIVIVVFLLALGLIYYFSRIPEIKEEVIPEKPEQEIIIEKQLKELEQLRGATPPLTEEEIQKQLEELEKLRH